MAGHSQKEHNEFLRLMYEDLRDPKGEFNTLLKNMSRLTELTAPVDPEFAKLFTECQDSFNRLGEYVRQRMAS